MFQTPSVFSQLSRAQPDDEKEMIKVRKLTTILTILAALILSNTYIGCGGDNSAATPGTYSSDSTGIDESTPIPGRGANAIIFIADPVTDESTTWDWGYLRVSGSGPAIWHIARDSHPSLPDRRCFRWGETRGRNYANNESDALTPRRVLLPENATSLTLSFWTRYKLAPGDYGYVRCSIDCGFFDDGVIDVLGGTSPDWPDWTRKEYTIPCYPGKWYVFEFKARSDASLTDWGWEIDDILVYGQ
jgi:hypothetical protein